MKENGRIVQTKYARTQFQAFIESVMVLPRFVLKNYKPASESVLQERYSFACTNKHISIVYETNSGTLVITAPEQILSILKTELGSTLESSQSANQSENKIHPAQSDAKKQPADQPEKPQPANQQLKLQPENQSLNRSEKLQSTLNHDKFQNAASLADSKSEHINKVENTQAATQINAKQQTTANAQSKNDQALTPQPNRNFAKPSSKLKALENECKPKNERLKQKSEEKGIDNDLRNQELQRKKAENEQQKQESEKAKLDELYKNGFAIKKYQPEKLENVLKNIKALKMVSCRQTPSEAGSRTYLISDKKNKVYLRYIDLKHTLQLQGKRSKLFGEVQVLVSQDSDYVTAVSSHIDLTGEEKRAGDMQKRLKKLLPNAFDFLSEQSRIDITIGMIDIGNDDVKLSDYSMLLVPPYRGLERLIYDLQRAKGIEVKMIGQAYEKQGSDYTLKVGYKRKINSIVYAEVMSALYTEYFAKRNFYAHSDITGDLLSRVITEKSAVKEIFNHLVQVIEYNITKLKEIGFKI